MPISFMTKLVILLFMINLNSFSIMRACLLACLAIAGATRGTSTEKIYQELGLEPLKSSYLFRKLCHFYKILNEKSPSYLFNLILNFNRVHNTKLSYNIPPIKVSHDYFKNSFFSFDNIKVEQA